MPTQKKINIVSDLTEKLSAAKSVVVTDYRGLTTSQIEELRQKTEEAGGNFVITKNTLLQLALQKSDIRYPISDIRLTGPTATLFSFADEVTPIKALANFAKEWKLPIVKFGFLGKDYISGERINELAKLPNRNELLAELIGQIQTPTWGLVNLLEENTRKLVYLLQGIKQSKGGEKRR
ncbi:MAG: 50S ribosomal protein L10 [Candidatus Cloacimonetes bacterium]|nr:50S ribosomal protein L10 [Candidatus Cloacimonadota bacterium]